MSFHPPPEVRPGGTLCAVEGLDDPGSRAFTVIFGDGRTLDIFVVRRGDALRAYVNDCPHQHLPLNWHTDRFLTAEKDRILCVMHAATFDIPTGAVLSGPMPASCALTPVPIRIEDGLIRLAADGLPAPIGGAPA